MKAELIKHDLIFKEPAGTSRGVITSKPGWFIKLIDENRPHRIGIGECSVIPGLSFDYNKTFEYKLTEVCENINDYLAHPNKLKHLPSIRFAIETALLDYDMHHTGILFPSEFTEGLDGIPMNGLIWMGTLEDMLAQVDQKIGLGYRSIKLKIGAHDFEKELTLFTSIREKYSADFLEIRLDANGAFSPSEALSKIEALATFSIHSLEQPIKAGQRNELKQIISSSSIPIALDEELIGISDELEMMKLLVECQPNYLILKPGLLGGFAICNTWVKLARYHNVGWWATSALESNVGLNAISQWVYTQPNPMLQGLGTGQLFSNNIPSPLFIKNTLMCFDTNGIWEYPF